MIRVAGRPMVLASVFALQLVGPAIAEDDARATRGREIAETACADCHAIGRDGASPRKEAPPFRELGRKYPVESLEEALAEGVVVGHPGMPQLKMNEADIDAFLAFLKSVQVP